MNCYKFRDSISLYIDKELSIKDINRFNHHLETCSSCRVLFQGTLNVVSSMKKIPAVTVSADFGKRLQKRITREQAREKTRRRRMVPVQRLGLQPRYAFASVTALVAILIISVSIFTGGNDDIPVGDTPPALSTREEVLKEENPPNDIPVIGKKPALFTREVVPQEETESHIPASSLAERSRADSSSNKMPVVSSHPQIPENQVRQVRGK